MYQSILSRFHVRRTGEILEDNDSRHEVEDYFGKAKAWTDNNTSVREPTPR
jgi:hypothetical protein